MSVKSQFGGVYKGSRTMSRLKSLLVSSLLVPFSSSGVSRRAGDGPDTKPDLSELDEPEADGVG